MKIKVGLIGFGRMGPNVLGGNAEKRSMGHRIYLRYRSGLPRIGKKPFPFIQNHIR